jgi:hypothetical protein
MKRSLLLLLNFAILLSCKKEENIDPSKYVRPVILRIGVTGGDYKLSWEAIRPLCGIVPCSDTANVEAEQYEIQIAKEELGTFQTYQTVSADQNSMTIPVSQGSPLVVRVLSKAKGAQALHSTPVMATNGFVSKSAFYPGFGFPANVEGGDITVDGKKAVHYQVIEETSGEQIISVRLAELANEQVVSTKLIARQGGITKFSPDGRQLAFPSRAEQGLVIYDINTGRSRTVPVADVEAISGLAWSPDAKWLAFSTVTNVNSRLWKIAAAGGTAVALTPTLLNRELNAIRQADINWSPDGQFIAISRNRSSDDNTGWRACVSFYSPEGNGEVKYFDTRPGWTDTAPSFSPDGKQMAFLSTRTHPYSNYAWSLWVRDLTTGQARRVELLPGLVPLGDYTPRWSGNERLIFMGYQQEQKGYFSVFL